MKLRTDEEYEFGPYRLNVKNYKLWRGKEEIKLRPKLFNLLVIFIEHHGQMLEKHELMRSLWPDSVVEDSNLTVTINALRAVLSDGLYIETVSKRGYRFTPEVKIVARDSSVGHDPSPEDLIEPPGGALPLHSPLYISRSSDDEFCHAIARHDSIVLVKGARQVGKTSLLARGLEAARMVGAGILLVDFQHFGPTAFASCGKLLLAMAELIAHQIELPSQPHENWNERLSPSSNFERFLRREVLKDEESYFVLALDEVDRLFNHDFASEILGLFRSWHNLRALDPNGPWYRLTIAIAYATEAHLFISDLNQSPFNVGTRLRLEDFTLQQLAELNDRYDRPLADEEQLTRFRKLVGGHPYLAQRGLYEMCKRRVSLAALEQQADHDDGPFGDHLNRLLISLERDEQLRQELRDFVLSDVTLSNGAFYRLRSAGILSGDSADEPGPRCDLYTRYLKRHLA
ncbi:MAG TPA: AAA-like domain-containing protein [Pyrinomonadaceae bacterium]|nr:AAA-like domain-containing protein [Pyrinomonadaceae bacterium]